MARVTEMKLTVCAIVVGIVLGISPARIEAQSVAERLKRAAEAAAKALEAKKKKAEEDAKTTGGTATAKPGDTAGAADKGAAGQRAGAAPTGANSSAKVDVETMMPVEPGQTIEYNLSPKGNHVVAVVPRGSRYAVLYDGVASQPFDEVIADSVAFSDDGRRYAYLARLGQEYVYMVDGKELARLPSTAFGTPASVGPAHHPAFTAHGRHVYFTISSTTTGASFFFDGKPIAPIPIPEAAGLTFSPDGERYAFHALDRNTGRQGPLIVDGKPTTWPGGAPQFTGNSKHLVTWSHISGGGADVFMDGKPWFRVPGGIQGIYTAPVTDLVVAIATPPSGRGSWSLLVNGKRVDVGVEAQGFGPVEFTPDGRHWATIALTAANSKVAIVDGKKELDYQDVNGLQLLPDGRAVYVAGDLKRRFVVVGGQESNAYALIVGARWDGWEAQRRHQRNVDAQRRGKPADDAQDYFLATGNHVTFVATKNAAASLQSMVVVHDGKEMPTPGGAQNVLVSPDGSRVFYATPAGQFVDGVQQPGVEFVASTSASSSVAFSPDGKHLAYIAYRSANRQESGIVLNGRFIPLTPRKQPSPADRLDHLTFAPDSRHLFFIARGTTARRPTIYVDGLSALEVDDQLDLTSGVIDGRWSVGEDGVLTLVAIEGNALKRFRITPGPNTSVDTLARLGAMQ